ncbi:MAG TPA: molybdopterin cofactor-binding domain-containing protein, partial [Vicinamibacterales bacterium]
MTVAYVGEPISRVDGRAKVTGQATYAGEPTIANLVYGSVVSSTITKGTIRKIDTTEALAVPGMLEVLTHENSPMPASKRTFVDEAGSPGETFIPFRNNAIKFNQQPVALVLADTFEVARYAATLVRVEYDREAHVTDLEAAMGDAYHPPWRELLPPVPTPRGDAEKALAAAAARVDVEYRAPAEHHNPMEPFASTAVWDDEGTLTVYDKTQGVKNVQGFLCSVFDYDDDQVRVLSRYVGGAFGSGLRPQYQVFLAVLAARQLKRSVKVTLTRQQMFSLCYRPFAWQRVALGASRDG